MPFLFLSILDNGVVLGEEGKSYRRIQLIMWQNTLQHPMKPSTFRQNREWMEPSDERGLYTGGVRPLPLERAIRCTVGSRRCYWWDVLAKTPHLQSVPAGTVGLDSQGWTADFPSAEHSEGQRNEISNTGGSAVADLDREWGALIEDGQPVTKSVTVDECTRLKQRNNTCKVWVSRSPDLNTRDYKTWFKTTGKIWIRSQC